MFNQPLLLCSGSAVQAAARGRAVLGCGPHMYIQWFPNVSPWGPNTTRPHPLAAPLPTSCWIFNNGLYFEVLYDVVVQKFTFAISSPEEFLLKSLNIWQTYREKLIALSALCACALSCWKIKNSLEIWCIGRNCCKSIMLWLIILTDLDSVIDKCKTGVMSTTCYSPTDVISDWTLIVCTGTLSRRLSSWLMDIYRVSKTSHILHAITLTRMNGFWYFLAEMLLIR